MDNPSFNYWNCTYNFIILKHIWSFDEQLFSSFAALLSCFNTAVLKHTFWNVVIVVKNNTVNLSYLIDTYIRESLQNDPIYGAGTFSQNLYLLCHLYLISIYVEPTVINTWCWKISILFWNLPDQTSYHMIHVNKIQSYYIDK